MLAAMSHEYFTTGAKKNKRMSHLCDYDVANAEQEFSISHSHILFICSSICIYNKVPVGDVTHSSAITVNCLSVD